MKKNNKGFTLLEVIIVLAIVGVLFSIIGLNYGDTLKEAQIKADIQSARILLDGVNLYEATEKTKITDLEASKLVEFLQEKKYVRNDVDSVPQSDSAGSFIFDRVSGIVKLKITIEDEILNKLSDKEKTLIEKK